MSEDNNVEPKFLLSDFVEIVYLSVVICLGIPANVISLLRLIREQRQAGNRDFVKSGFVMLKIHLNVTDFLILAHAVGKISWLIAYGWYIGEFSCKVFQMFSIFSLYSSSNIVVCIALDRLRNVVNANKLQTKTKKINIVTILAACSWIFAFIFSIPQYVFFQTIDLNENFTQCSDIWQISRYRDPNNTQQSFILSKLFEDGYNIAHLVLVFWGPLVILTCSYALIATKVMKYSLKRPGAKQNDNLSTDCRKDLIIRMNTEDGLCESRSSLKQFIRCGPEETTTTLETLSTRRDTTTKVHSNSPRFPTWRKQMRGKVFRTTMLVILTHFLFWFPYNTYGLMKYVHQGFFATLSEQVNIFNDLQFLIVLINPFLYGFS